MSFTPGISKNGNTVTAQYNTQQAETPPKELTTKDTQILKSLESALPFFDASDYGVKAQKGEAETPPVKSEGSKGSSGVKDFFKSIGKAIVSGFEKIGDFFKGLGKSEAKTPDPRKEYYGDSRVPLPDLTSANLNKAGGQLAFAFASGGQDGLSNMVGKMSDKVTSEMQKTNFQGTVGEFIEAKLSFTSDLGYALEGQSASDVKQLVPQLKLHFADNPVALALLDAIDTYDFATEMQSDYTKQIDGLKSENNPLGSFLRSNNSVSLGVVAMARADGFDQNTVANSILTKHVDEMDSLQKSISKLKPEDQRKEVLTGKNATKMMDLTKSLLMDALKTDGPGGLKESFGEEHIQRLNDMAQQIADRDDLPVDVRNKAIETVYIDQLFLRGVMTALTNTVKPGSVEYTAVQLGQSILNGATGAKFVTEDMRNAYTEVAQEFRQNFVQAMIELGMPVVQ